MMAAAHNQQATSHFCHNPHAASVLQGLQDLRAGKVLVDVTLCVSGKEIPCHRNVLAACSEYFRAMFCNGHLETKEHKVFFHEVSSSTLELLVDYAYTSSITITEDNAVKILEGANFFRILPVYDACVKFISNNLSAKNCLQIVHISNMLSCPDLEKKAQVCAMKEFKAVSKTPEFLYLTKDQLVALTTSDDLNASEEVVYEAVMAWIKHDTRKRKKEMRELMELVRFPFMDRLYFLENVENNKDMHKFCSDIITETRRYQLFPGDVQSARTRPRHASGLREAVVIIGGIEREGPGEGVYEYRPSSHSVTMSDSAEPSPSSWVPMTSVDLNTKCGFAVAVIGTSEIILSSGKQVVQFQPELNTWTNLAPKTVEQYHHKLAVVHGKVYAIGGFPISQRPVLADVEVYDRSQHKWTAGVSLPQPRYAHAVAVVDGSIYVMGGFDAVDTNKPTSTVYRFTPGDSHWQPQRDMPEAAAHIKAAVLNGKVYVPMLGKVVCFEPDDRGGSWSVVVNRRLGDCYGITVFRGKVYVYGHCSRVDGIGCGSTEVLRLDPEPKSLNHVGNMAKGLFGHGCVTILKCY